MLGGLRAIYYDHKHSEDAQEGFRSGAAWLVVPNPDGGLDSDSRIQIAANSLHALDDTGAEQVLFSRD